MKRIASAWWIKPLAFWLVVFAIIFLALVACDAPIAPRNIQVNPELQSGRIVIVSAQAFKDSGNNDRNVLVLRDTKTGVEYLAVTGAGVTQMYRECKIVSDGDNTTTTICSSVEK